jgi:hypothetical protein
MVASLGLVITGQGSVGGTTISVEGIASIGAAEAFNEWSMGLEGIFEA